MRKTENLELNLPEPDDFFDVSHQNENFETIDEELNNKAEKDGTNATGTWNINITGNSKTATKATSADSATKATQDGDGNVITETYAEKETIALKSATGASISIADSKEAPMILNYAPVNLFSHSFATTTKSGITFTANADGTITANGTATGNIEITVGTHTFTENDVGKKFSWSDNGITKVADINWDALIFMNYINGASSWRASYCFTVETAHTVNIKIYVLKGEVLENKVFRPMLEEGSTYHTYVPYTGYDITASNDEASKSTSVTINSETVFPVNGLESYDGLTNVLNPYSATMEVTYATNEAGQGILKEIETKAEINGSNATGDWNINITGNSKTATKATSADSATKATQDGDGENIASTYLKAGMWKTHYYDGLNGGKLLILLEDVTEWYKGTKQKYVDFTAIITIGREHWYGHSDTKMAICQAGLGYYYTSGKSSLCTTNSAIRPIIVSKTENDATTYYLALLSGHDFSGGQFLNMLYSCYVNGGINTPLLTKIIFNASLQVPDGYSIVRDDKTLFIEAEKATSADSAKNLKNTYTNSTRPTSANVDMTANLGLVSYMLATSNMTEGKPYFDGHILTFNWDNSTGNGAQLFLPNNTGKNAQFRGRSNSSGWEDWKTFLDSNNYSNYAIPLTGTTALAGDITPETNNKYDLGDATHRFYYGYFENIYAKQSLHSLYHYIEDSSGVNQGRLEYSGLTDVMYSSYVSTSTNDLTKSDIVGIDLYGYTNLRVRAQNRLYFNAGTTISASMSITTGSDEKIKKFTDDIEQDKEALIKLFDIIQIKSYRYRYSKGNALTLGFSAQDVEEACNEIGIDPEKYGILNISYNHHMCQGEEEDMKYYPKFYEISYNDMYNLALFKIQSMEKEHKEILEEHNNRLKALEEKLV